MSISVTNSVSTLIINDSSREIAVSKQLIRVSNTDSVVRIQWSPTEFVGAPYTDFTAPTGASALAVKNAIEAFLDSGIVVTVTPGYQYAEDSAAVSGDQGAFIMGVRNDANAALTSADGDYSPISVDSTGRVKAILASNTGVDIGDVDVTSVIPGTGATNLGKAIDTVTGATDTGVLSLATRDDALSALTPIEGDNVQLRTDANGALWTHDDALDAALSGSELQVDIVASIPAGTNNIGDVDVLSISPGAGATNLGKAQDAVYSISDTGVFILAVRNDVISGGGLTSANGDYSQISVDDAGRVGTRDNKAEDVAHVTGDVGSFILGVRNDANAALTSLDGDYSPISVDSTGRVKVIPAANSGVDIGDVDILSIAAGDNNIGNVDVLSVIPGTGATNLGKAEDAAHTTGDVGVEMLGVRNDANAALSGTDLDYTPLATDSAGRIKYAQTVATVSQSITRPADTTAYAAGDVIATATASGDSTLSFANAVKENNGVGTIIGAFLIDSVNAATKGDFDLWLFDTAPADQNDNAAFAPTDAEADTCLGVIQFLGADARTTSNNAVYEGFLQNPITIVGLSGAANIIGVLVVRNAYTPTSAEIFRIRLRIEQY